MFWGDTALGDWAGLVALACSPAPLEVMIWAETALGDWASAATCRLDSFVVAVCDNIRIPRSRILKGEIFRGKHAAMRSVTSMAYGGCRSYLLRHTGGVLSVVPGR